MIFNAPHPQPFSGGEGRREDLRVALHFKIMNEVLAQAFDKTQLKIPFRTKVHSNAYLITTHLSAWLLAPFLAWALAQFNSSSQWELYPLEMHEQMTSTLSYSNKNT